MLSRRNVRIKVMQHLYAKNIDSVLTDTDIINRYQESIRDFTKLYLFNLYVIIRITQLALGEASNRSKKHIKEPYDDVFTDKLFSNPLTQSLVNHVGLNKKFETLAFEEMIDGAFVHKLYKSFAKEPFYREYVANVEANAADHLECLLTLYRFIKKSEFFEDLVESRYAAWNDDSSLIAGAIKRTLKKLPAEGEFYDEYLPEEDAVKDFGEGLVKYILDKDTELENIITPTLKNWDKDRVATLDMVLLKMAVAEFVAFESIPTKVTLNEYVELAKQYSTEKSKEFVNGVLDKIMKDLIKDGRIVKKGRGLRE